MYGNNLENLYTIRFLARLFEEKASYTTRPGVGVWFIIVSTYVAVLLSHILSSASLADI